MIITFHLYLKEKMEYLIIRLKNGKINQKVNNNMIHLWTYDWKSFFLLKNLRDILGIFPLNAS